MKSLVINVLVGIVSLVVGFLICFYMLGRDLNATFEQTNISNQLILLNTILDKVNDSSPDESKEIDSFYRAICSTLPYIKQEAIDAGKPISDILNVVEYTEATIKRYKLAAQNIDSVVCNI